MKLDNNSDNNFLNMTIILPLSSSTSSMTLLAMTAAASVKTDSTKYRPGSAIIFTPLSGGKNSSRAPLITPEN